MDPVSAPPSSTPPASVDLEIGLPASTLFQLGRELQAHGASADHIERVCTRVGSVFELQGEVLATSAQLTMSFAGGHRSALFARGPVPQVHLARLDQLTRSAHQVLTGESDAAALARALEQPTPGMPLLLRRLMHPASATAMACVLGGGWREAAVGALGGVACGLLEHGAEALPRLEPIVPALASFATFQTAIAMRHAGLTTLDTGTAAMASAYLLLPGLTATLGLVEISQQHLQAGSARVLNAFRTWSQLAVGALLAGLVWQQRPVMVPGAAAALWRRPAWWPCQVAAGVATGAAMQARPRMLVQSAIGSLVGAGGWTLGAAFVDDSLGCLLAGTAVVLAARASASLTGGSDWPMLYPPLQLLVPGSGGLRGLVLLLDGDLAEAYSVMKGASLRAVCLSLGILTGQAVAHVGGTLKSACGRALRRRVASVRTPAPGGAAS